MKKLDQTALALIRTLQDDPQATAFPLADHMIELGLLTSQLPTRALCDRLKEILKPLAPELCWAYTADHKPAPDTGSTVLTGFRLVDGRLTR